MAIVTLTTDFGTADGYVGAMKGVILSRAPDARIVDIAHDVPPHDRVAAAYVLAQSITHFPPDSIHVCVVDPGVGSARAAIAVDNGNYRLVRPDNGVFTWVLGDTPRCHRIETSDTISNAPSTTFHGRDIFAPCAAMLAQGKGIAELGAELAESALIRLRPQEPASVVHIDHFGNIITGFVPRRDTPVEVVIAGTPVVFGSTFSSVAVGEAIAYVGSAGTLEVAIRDGRASDRFRCKRGDRLMIREVHDGR